MPKPVLGRCLVDLTIDREALGTALGLGKLGLHKRQAPTGGMQTGEVSGVQRGESYLSNRHATEATCATLPPRAAAQQHRGTTTKPKPQQVPKKKRLEKTQK